MTKYRIIRTMGYRGLKVHFRIQWKRWLFWYTLTHGHGGPCEYETLYAAEDEMGKQRRMDTFKPTVVYQEK